MTYTQQQVETICKEWMTKHSKESLYRDYRNYLDDYQVKKFIWYVEEEIKKWNIYSPSSYLYDWFCEDEYWFRDYECEFFSWTFKDEFFKDHPELEEEWYDVCDECLWNEMYNQDKIDYDLEHFDKEYNFYILTNPEKTIYKDNYIEYNTYFNSFKQSQHITINSNTMRWLFADSWWCCWLCVKVNCNLFDFINLMKQKKLTIKKWSKVFLFNPFNWSWWDSVELVNDWTIRNDIKNIWFDIDWWRHWARWYTPDEVYGFYHSYFDSNFIY